ncbi:hypothetical protein M0805_009395 [Coniferiporia weirii]|nr:hypothetical protein M0805_009395 [Coniferiporia weirii]
MSIDLTLQRIDLLLSCFEKYTRPTVHIAGTNGKGSVSALLTHIFLAAGLSVGRFNSPHLVNVSDSIAINDTPVTESRFESVMAEVRTMNEERTIHASSFEVLTVTALLLFERAGVDVVICEVGMGGRLDATNIIPDSSILISAITSIDLDHQTFLGSTVADIAREKAGIIRRGCPVVLGFQKHDGVEGAVRAIAQTARAQLILAPAASDREWDEAIDGPTSRPFSLDPFFPPPPRPVEVRISEAIYKLLLPLHGDHQLANLGTAIAVFHALAADTAQPTCIQENLARMNAKSLHEAVRSCSWPGRLSFHAYNPRAHGALSSSSPVGEFTILADGAHNSAASEMLASYVADLLCSLAPSEGKRKSVSLTYILALSHSPPKTPSSVLLPLLSTGPLMAKAHGLDIQANVAFLHFSPPDGMPWVKAVPPSELAEIALSANNLSGETDCKWNIWKPSDIPSEISDTQNAQHELERAIAWVVDQSANLGVDAGPRETLVVVAGSLYLVADLYRLLGSSEKTSLLHV